jgi:hypothetical protein
MQETLGDPYRHIKGGRNVNSNLNNTQSKIHKTKIIAIFCCLMVLFVVSGIKASENVSKAYAIHPPSDDNYFSFEIVGEKELEAIESGEISLDDGVTRVWDNPNIPGTVAIARIINGVWHHSLDGKTWEVMGEHPR